MYLYEVVLTKNGKCFLFNMPAQIVDEALRFDFENPVNNPFKSISQNTFTLHMRNSY